MLVAEQVIWQLAATAANGFLTGMFAGLGLFLMFAGVYVLYDLWRSRREG